MLEQLLALLATRNYADSTRRRYTGYLRNFAGWCVARGVSQFPPGASVIARYFKTHSSRDRKRVAAIDTVYAAANLPRPSLDPAVEEILIAVGLRSARRTSVKPTLRRALSDSTRALYARRVARYAEWCRVHRQRPSIKSLDRFLNQLDVQPKTRAQYRVAIRSWTAFPITSQQPSKPSPPAKQKPAEQPVKSTRRALRRLVLRTPEQRLLFQLGRTGIAEHHRHARQLARVDARRLALLERRGFIEMHTGLLTDRQTKQIHAVRYYSLAPKGRRWLGQQGVRHVYRWNPQQVGHDLHLTDLYYRLSPKVRRTWMCETELIERLGRRFEPGHAVDAAVIANGEAWAIEVAIGYKRVDIAKKQAFIDEVFGGRGVLIT